MKRLADGARALDIPLSDEQLGAFKVYYETLITWNTRVNLTRITDYEAVQVKHFLDSLSCMAAIRRIVGPSFERAGNQIRVIDVGTGAGFPGLPLKIVLPGLRLTLLEATGKKVEFLQALVERLGLTGVEAVKARAEGAGRDPAHREQYDLALARALAGMATLAELMLPFVHPGGLVIAQKGEDPSAEVEASQHAIVTLGGQVREVLPVMVPGLEGSRHLVVLNKVSATPHKYPRRPGMPAKRPIT